MIFYRTVNRLNEGLEEILAFHRLGPFLELKISFKTMNCIESFMALLVRKPIRSTILRIGISSTTVVSHLLSQLSAYKDKAALTGGTAGQGLVLV